MSTLKRIADSVGCSISTVSRAMNNCRDVSDETKKRVSEVARALGYYERKKRIKTEKITDSGKKTVALLKNKLRC